MTKFLINRGLKMFPIGIFFYGCIILFSACDKKDMNIYTDMSKMHLSIITIKQNSVIDTFLTIHITLKTGWHTYWINPGESGLAPRLTWNLPEGVVLDTVQYPTPTRINESGIVSIGYHDSLTAMAQIHFKKGVSGIIRGYGSFLICKDVCIPIQCTASVELSGEIERMSENSKRFLWYPKNDTALSSTFSANDSLIFFTFYHPELSYDGNRSMDLLLITPGVLDLSADPSFSFLTNYDTLMVTIKKSRTLEVLPKTLRGIIITNTTTKKTHLFTASQLGQKIN